MKRKPEILIRKASGAMLPFSHEKLLHSLKRAGADEALAQSILSRVLPKLYPGVSTKQIYRWAFNMLKGRAKNVASRYHLKRAIMELGPSGFPFEKLVAEILKRQGYRVQIGQIVKGKCVNHEIDVIAEKDQHHFMIECKYHNQDGTVSDVKTSLYVHARFKDVEASWLLLPGHDIKFHQGWLVTNTRFSQDAITYGECAGLKLIGWNYPEGESLRYLIDKLGLYPITCMETLNKAEKQSLLQSNIVLSGELSDNESILLQAGIKSSRISAVMDEARKLSEMQRG